MTRDEWMVLPDGLHIRREDISSYYEKPMAPGWTFISVARNGVMRLLDSKITVAEFEALLFGAEPDAYTRAAVAYAEAQYRFHETTDWPAADDRINALNEFGRLYRERHDAQR